MRISSKLAKNKKYKLLRKKEKKSQIFNKKFLYYIISIIIFLLIIIIILRFIGFNINLNFLFHKSKLKKNNKIHFNCCFCTMGKQENLYAAELISYYMNLGVDKFVIGDDNLPNTEKFSDVLQDYIDSGYVDIIDIGGKFYDYSEFFDIMYQKYQYKCDWLTFFDFDEYLVVLSDDGKNITINQFLSNKRYDKCQSISINWLMYGDNDLVYYDKRPALERFTRPDYNNWSNKFIKSIVRGNLNKTIFVKLESNHMPIDDITQCNSLGEIIPKTDEIIPPIYNYGYIMHLNIKTAEEYAQKIKRGIAGNQYFKPVERVKLFFSHNKFTQEKLKVFEKAFNRTFYIPIEDKDKDKVDKFDN